LGEEELYGTDSAFGESRFGKAYVVPSFGEEELSGTRSTVCGRRLGRKFATTLLGGAVEMIIRYLLS
jgi:hypothetical protein